MWACDLCSGAISVQGLIFCIPNFTRNCQMRQVFKPVCQSSFYLRQGGDYVIGAVCVSFILSVSKIIVKVISRFHWKLVSWLGLPFGRTDLLLVVIRSRITHSGSLFHFPRHCGKGDFRRFIIISHSNIIEILASAEVCALWELLFCSNEEDNAYANSFTFVFFFHFDRIHERERQTARRTDRHRTTV